VRILSIDPAIRNTGYAVVDGNHQEQRALDHGVISIPTKLTQSKALGAIASTLGNLIKKWEPDEVAVEGIIYVQSHRTAISMGAARGAALIAAASHGLRVFEYAPTKVKQAVVGKGAADKKQVAFMVRALLGLSETPSPDAADALAIGLAHLFSSDPSSQKAVPRKEV
jgi:crossover junction endodeoxyribonuclease RuvC